MAGKKIISLGNQTSSHDIYSAPANAAVADALLIEGTFVGLNNQGEIVIADNRNSQSKPAARGALIHSHQNKDFRGNVLDFNEQMSYCRAGKIGNLSGLTPGATYYLSSGGGITPTKPVAAGDLAQEVGYAETPSILVIALGPAIVV